LLNLFVPKQPRRLFFAVALGLNFTAVASAAGRMTFTPMPLSEGFLSAPPFLDSSGVKSFEISKERQDFEIQRLCNELDRKFEKLGWRRNPCEGIRFEASLASHRGYPLIYAVFGNGQNRTVLISGVHPDELTPIPMGFKFAKYLTDHPETYSANDQTIVVVPLVNPDGFFIDNPTRTNHQGVDLNRNFFTLDWYANAHLLWEKNRKKDRRYFPGHVPHSEIETVFQGQMLTRFQPHKILSIHAPLGFLDYDGPGDGNPESKDRHVKSAREWVQAISRRTKDYRVVDYSFYPGSIGNYGGNDRNIPTVTLELQSTDPRKVEEYWKSFLPGLLEASAFSIPNESINSKNSASAPIGQNQSVAAAHE
jgi:murein peptide amidase A